LRRQDKDLRELLIFCVPNAFLATFIKRVVSLQLEALLKEMVDLTVFYALGIALVIAGVIVIVLALIRTSTDGKEKGEVRGAGVIMIGPIPIIFGTDKKSVKEVLVLALGLVVVMLIVFVVYYWWLR